MRRRALLSAVALGSTTVAGCSMLDGEPTRRDRFDVSETTREATTTRTYTVDRSGLSRGFGVSNREQAVAMTTPESIPESIAVTLGFTSDPSELTPATVYMEVTVPESEDGPVSLPVGATPPASSYVGTRSDGGSGMYLVPEEAGREQSDLVRRDVGCWRPILPVGPEEEAASTGQGTGRKRTLQPGESIGRKYFLVTPWAHDRCLQLGTYRFETAAGWGFWVCSFDVVSPPSSRFGDASLPEIPGRVSVEWTHEADASLFVAADSESVGLPRATNEFTVHNQLYREITVQASSWALYKLEAGSWYPIAPLSAVGTDERRLLPGESASLSLTYYTDPDRPSEGDRTAVGGLGPGRYAVTYPAELAIPGVTHSDDETPVPGALVDVVGERPSLTASDDLDHVTADGDTLQAYTTADESSVAVLELTRTDDRPERRLIHEQVLQREALRNALRTLRRAGEDATAVAYHVDPSQIERVLAWIDPEADGLTFTYEDESYELSYA